MFYESIKTTSRKSKTSISLGLLQTAFYYYLHRTLYLVYNIHGQLVKKTTVLSIAFINVNMSESLSQHLTSDFLDFEHLSAKKNEICTYDNLLIQENPDSENLEYAYASSARLLAAIDSKKNRPRIYESRSNGTIK